MPRRARTIRKQALALKFARLKAQGFGNLDAWRQLRPENGKLPIEQQWARSAEFARDPLVVCRVAEVLQAAHVQALDSSARFHARVLDDIELARQRDNMTAVMAGHRILGSRGAFLTENFVTADHGLSLAQLVDKLRELSPAAADAISQSLGLVSDIAPQPSQEGNSSQVPQGQSKLTH